MMIRKVIVPTTQEYILQIPEPFIGKNVEVLAFEVSETDREEPEQENKEERLEDQKCL